MYPNSVGITKTTYNFVQDGKITLEIREPVSRELLWTNNVTFTTPPSSGPMWPPENHESFTVQHRSEDGQ